MMLFYTYINKSWFEKAYHYGRNEITIDEWIPWFKTFGECTNDVGVGNDLELDEVVILGLEAKASNLLSKSLESFNYKGGELTFKVKGQWEINSVPRIPTELKSKK